MGEAVTIFKLGRLSLTRDRYGDTWHWFVSLGLYRWRVQVEFGWWLFDLCWLDEGPSCDRLVPGSRRS